MMKMSEKYVKKTKFDKKRNKVAGENKKNNHTQLSTMFPYTKI